MSRRVLSVLMLLREPPVLGISAAAWLGDERRTKDSLTVVRQASAKPRPVLRACVMVAVRVREVQRADHVGVEQARAALRARHHLPKHNSGGAAAARILSGVGAASERRRSVVSPCAGECQGAQSTICTKYRTLRRAAADACECSSSFRGAGRTLAAACVARLCGAMSGA